MTFQDPASPIMAAIIDLHHDVFTYLIGILIITCGYLIAFTFEGLQTERKKNDLSYRKSNVILEYI